MKKEETRRDKLKNRDKVKSILKFIEKRQLSAENE